MNAYWIFGLSLLLLGCVPKIYPPSSEPQHARPAISPDDPGDKEALVALVAPYGQPEPTIDPATLAFERGLKAELQEDALQAQRLYQEAVTKGSPYAALRLGEMHLEGQGVMQDHQKAIALFEQAASGGLSSAQRMLGDSYFFGRGTIKSPKKAFEAYKKGAEQDDPYAQYMLSIFYKEGISVPQDLALSVEWYFKAETLSGNADAKYRVGRNYQLGRGFIRDLENAFAWMERAADQKNAQALVALGDFYREGKVVDRDPAKAIVLYHQAHEQGSAYAQYNIGMMYYNGEGFPRDPLEAARWFMIAAHHGAEHAQYRLAQMFFEGQGVKQDDVQAFAWWSISAKNRVEGKHLPQLAQLIDRMSPEQQQKALALAETYREQYHKSKTPY